MNTWITKDGTEISISDMTDSHLSNAYNMANRNFERKCAIGFNRCHGFDDVSNLGDAAHDYYEDKIKPLTQEMKSRNLVSSK